MPAPALHRARSSLDRWTIRFPTTACAEETATAVPESLPQRTRRQCGRLVTGVALIPELFLAVVETLRSATPHAFALFVADKCFTTADQDAFGPVPAVSPLLPYFDRHGTGPRSCVSCGVDVGVLELAMRDSGTTDASHVAAVHSCHRSSSLQCSLFIDGAMTGGANTRFVFVCLFCLLFTLW